MAYVVLARKYRPGTLAELVGQEHIARALTNAIEMKRVPHALLFCGARGTGKTSTARIVAKMLNCVHGPTATPCGQCSPCKEIATSNCIDVLEVDAASNRGIDEIRELRSGVGYAPARDRSKIYIIDEAHMLTDQAANAFLKTLEEPPSHVTFILATTDPQRLPITIRSRCQRYDFRRVKAADVVQKLGELCKSEGVETDLEALYLIAREGDGSMRDSLSVLDQVIAFGGAKLNATDVADLLGVADRNRTHKLMVSLLKREVTVGLAALAAAHDHGMDLKTFARTLAMEARDVLVTRLAGNTAKDLVDRAENEIQAMVAMAEGVPTQELERISHVLLELAETVGRARHPRLVLELGVVRLCRAAPLVDVAELAVRVEGLLAAAPRLLAGGRSGGQGSAAPAGNPGYSGGMGGAPPPAGRPFGAAAPTQSAAAPFATHKAPVNVDKMASLPPRTPVAAPVAILKPQVALTDADIEKWQAAVRHQVQKPVVASLLDSAVVSSSEPGRVTLAFGNDFWTDAARQSEALTALTQAAAIAFGGAWQVTIGPPDLRARSDSLGAKRVKDKQQERQSLEQLLRQDRAVKMVIDALDGEITNVSPIDQPVPPRQLH